MSNPYLDIHTHRRSPLEGSVNVECLSLEELKREHSTVYTSAAIHPWWTEDHSREELQSFKNHIEKMAQEGKLWAIGETGIDRAYPEFLDLQIELFHWHLELAEKYQLPMVIHSVRAGSEFQQIMKEKKPSTPWIFHDFRGNEILMRSLLKLHPRCYFSFGLSLDNSPQIRELIGLVPMEHLFLETDSQKHLDIHDIYLRASEHMHVDLDFLKAQIWHNFKQITDKKLN